MNTNTNLNKPLNLYFDFLDGLRESGITNMWGAAGFLEDEFPELNKQEAKTVLLAWMDQFKK